MTSASPLFASKRQVVDEATFKQCSEGVLPPPTALLRKSALPRAVLLGELTKFLVEFVNTASRIYKLHFASEEGMAVSRNFHLHKGILFAVFPLNGFLRIGAGAAEESIVGGNVFEHHGAIALRMNIIFHS